MGICTATIKPLNSNNSTMPRGDFWSSTNAYGTFRCPPRLQSNPARRRRCCCPYCWSFSSRESVGFSCDHFPLNCYSLASPAGWAFMLQRIVSGGRWTQAQPAAACLAAVSRHRRSLFMTSVQQAWQSHLLHCTICFLQRWMSSNAGELAHALDDLPPYRPGSNVSGVGS